MIKKIFFGLILFVFIGINVLKAQDNRIYTIKLKNGYSVKGKIIEQTDQVVKIKTQNGEVFEYKKDDISDKSDANQSSSSGSTTKARKEIRLASNAITFGIKGGVNFANVVYSGGGTTSSDKSITAIHVGPVADFQLQQNLFMNTGLLFSIKGTKTEGVDGETISINYLEVPLNLAYKFPISENSKFLIQAGPYLGYALSGKDKYSGESTDITFGDPGGMKRLDFGLGFGAGIEFGSIILSANYELGLSNIIDESSYKIKNKVFQISLAYMFGGSK